MKSLILVGMVAAALMTGCTKKADQTYERRTETSTTDQNRGVTTDNSASKPQQQPGMMPSARPGMSGEGTANIPSTTQ